MKIFSNVTEVIGHTPLIELSAIEKEFSLPARIAVKAERQNPAGSTKDRAALNMINNAEARGILKPGATIIEPTSGNTGVGLAMVAAVRGYRLILTMPETMSAERRKLLSAYGAELVLTSGTKGMTGAIEMANELAKNTPDSIIMGQFSNAANAEAHYKTTGPEIWNDTDGKIDIFISGVGTGGTITGTGKYLKEKNPNIKIIAVEPENSAVLSGGSAGSHGLQGIGAGFVPDLLDTDIFDEIIPVSDNNAFAMGKLLARKEGLLCGITSGAAAYAAVETAKKSENSKKLIVALMPDTGERYLSTDMFK